MTNIWFIRPGKNAFLWDDCKDKKCIVIGWEDEHGFEKFKSLDDVKNQGYKSKNSNSIWIFHNEIQLNDIVVATGKDNTVLGVGVIKSDYLPPNHPDNPGLKYKNARMVDWRITEDLKIKTKLAIPTVTRMTEHGEKIWNELKHEYTAMNPDYKEIFAELYPDLPDLIKLFMRELDGDVLQELQEHHNRRRKNIQEMLTRDNLATLSESDMRKILDDTDAARGMKMTIGSIIPKNDGIEKFKEKLINLLDKTDLNETDINKLIKSFKGMGPGILSELLCLKNPTKFWITNKVTDEYFSLMGIDIKSDIPRGKKGDDGLKYVAMKPHLLKIRDLLKDNGFQNATFLDADMFAYWTTLRSPTSPNVNPVEPVEFQFKPLHETFKHTKNVILYGPPGTGKTYIAQQFIEEFLENRGETKSYYEFVTFHQSYGYEDFIEGLKPIVENNQVLYNIEAGVFKEFCNKARDDKDENSKYLFIIDEINRGNIAKIFGELITLIEDDKRNKIPTKLPYSKEYFTVPANVHILGTMNTADRSIALLDIALRRRFAFLELMPDSSLLNYEIDGLNLGDLLTKLNNKITDLLDREHQIGHSYFIGVIQENDIESAKNKLHFVWYTKVIPLLQEYFYNDWTQLEKILGNFVIKIDSNYTIYPCEGDDFITRLKGIANNGVKPDNPKTDVEPEENGNGEE